MNPRYRSQRISEVPQPIRWHDRTPLLAVFLSVTAVIFVGRLFYLQVVKHDEYKNAAIAEQLKKFSIPAERGVISILSGDKAIPLVLNESKYLLYADPSFIDDAPAVAAKLQPILGGSVDDITAKLQTHTRYIELNKKLDKQARDKIEAFKLKGIVTKEERYRTYPEGQFAAPVLGFVNYDGEGQYGIEGYLNQELSGLPGQLKAVTDVRGVPLAGNSDNIVKAPVAGQDITLTLDATIQRIAEEAIKSGVENTHAKQGNVVIYDISNGEIKGMANWPSFDPSSYDKVTDAAVFRNYAVTDPLEVGSIMKTLTMAAAFDLGVISKDGTYADKGYEEVDGYRITNAKDFGSGQFPIYDIIGNSLNTGAVYMLKQMGGGELNEKGRTTWHNYLTDHYQFGKQTGVEQSGEGSDIIPDPIVGDGRNIQYANTAFGQGLTITTLQMAAAFASIINGGTYYKPHLIHSTMSVDGTTKAVVPQVVKADVISPGASADIVSILEKAASLNNHEATRAGFAVGGKTGTAQMPDGNGSYRTDIYNGTFAGFVGGKKPEYAIIVSIDEPHISGFAGSIAARPVFTAITNAMLDNLPFQPSL